MTTDPFTEAAREEAERRWSRDQTDGSPLPGYARMSRRIGFEIGALWARTRLAAQEPTDAEQIIDQHRQDGRSVGYGVTVRCACGDESWGYIDDSRPIDDENNSHRVADRKHAAHVADMLARAARRDEERQDA